MSNSPDPIDVHVGQRLRARREECKLSRNTVGQALGVTYQQVEKYEKGSNRVSASMLWGICRVLGVKPGFFFEGL